MSVTNIIVLGAGGNLGSPVVEALLASQKFYVSVLTRPESKSTFPSDVKVVTAEYTLPSLQVAFSGQDVVLAVVGAGGFASQKIIVDAAIAAGVKRFIPSEFGVDINPETIAFIPALQGKKDLVDYLISKESSISWTVFKTGAFFDWGLKFGFIGFDLPNRKADLLDGGHTMCHVTNVSTIAKAVVASLSTSEGYEKTKNQHVRIADHEVSQRDILSAIERITGDKWEVKEMDSEPLVEEARKKIVAGNYGEVFTLIRALMFGKVNLGKVGKLWNDELGLPQGDLDEDLKLILDGKSP
ncbi:hypothetical protein DL96DRAFT_1706586 [Flagelloscypha sp. PMI_526]|nr:hypothetical protein DL96DRAFT_1706586 [Flagelloscypha sp. PMI_526]